MVLDLIKGRTTPADVARQFNLTVAKVGELTLQVDASKKTSRSASTLLEASGRAQSA